MSASNRKRGLFWMENTAWFADGSGNYRDLGRLTEAAAYDWARRNAVPVFRLSPTPSGETREET